MALYNQLQGEIVLASQRAMFDLFGRLIRRDPCAYLPRTFAI